MTKPTWGWRILVDAIDAFEMARVVDDEPSKIRIEFVQGQSVMRAEGTFCELDAIEFAMSKWRSAERKPRYQQLLEKWRDDGTFDRLDAAIEARTEVRIKRSSGQWQSCVITSRSGHAGLTSSVEWPDESAPKGKLFKPVNTEDLIEWNPELGPS